MSDSLGTAHGRITIDTAGVRNAQREVQQASQIMNQALGAIGISVSVAGFVQLARSAANFAIEVDEIAVAYKRQTVAAVSLAGSQAKLNELLEAYAEATGNAVDRATSLENVTKLMAVGFADNAEELDKFARAIRGISLAMGASEDTVTQNLILELFTQRGARLDQLGLQYDKVRVRADQLKASDRGLTDQMAYQQAVLEQAIERFGALTESAEGQVSGLESARNAWKDLRLEIGQATQPVTNTLGLIVAQRLQYEIDLLNFWINAVKDATEAIRDFNLARMLNGGPGVSNNFSGGGTAGGFGGGGGGGGFGGPADLTSDQTAVITQWWQATRQIEQQANADRISATQQYEQQRTSVIRDYGKTIVRDAEDFARQRQRAEEDSARSITRVREDSLRRDERMAEDFARAISNARADSAERIADAQKDANKRLADIDADFKRNQKRREEDFKDDMLSAAGRLDAIRLLELRKDRARQLKDAEDAHKKQRDDLQEQLAERIDDENKSLEKSTRQQQEAYERQLADARDADARRLADMEAEFALRKEREDEDRAVRLERLAQDHADQLAELNRSYTERIAEITRREAEATTEVTRAMDERLVELGVHNEKLEAEQRRHEALALEMYRQHTAAQEALLRSLVPQGPNNRIPLPSFATPSYNPVPGWERSRSVTVQSGAVTIYAAPNQSVDALWDVFEDRFVQLINEN